MTGIVKTDQIQGAQGTTVTVPSGNTLAVTSNATVGGTLGVTGDVTATNTSGNRTLGIITGTSNSSILNMGDTDAANVGQVKYHHGVNSMVLRTNGSDKVTLDSTGNLLFNAAGTGVYLGVTSATAANLLDDYEEGTFTPTWNGYSPAGTTGRFTKIGRQVMVYTELITGTSTDTSEVQIDNLPFTVSGSLGGGTVWHNTTGLYPYTPLTLMTANSTVCKLKTVVGSGNEVGVKYNDGSSQPTLGGSASLRWAIFYETS